MNEPHDQSASAWLGSANAAIAAIRNAGAMQEILVPGSYWDGAGSWTTTDNATVIGTGVQDSRTTLRSKSTNISMLIAAARIRAWSPRPLASALDRDYAMGRSERLSSFSR